jgi:hypothetical protein
MRVVSLLVAFLSTSFVLAQETNRQTTQAEPNVPTNLAEAHAALERLLSPAELAKIDAMASEGGMAQYHFSLGLSMRNGWGLWQGSALAKHMRELGFAHPDHMSSVILGTFWCKRHGQPLCVEERAAAAKKSMETARNEEEEVKNREQSGYAAMRDMMMGLQFEKRDVPVVQIPDGGGRSVRFLCPFRGGVFFTVYCQSRLQHSIPSTGGYYVDPASGESRRRPDMDDSVTRAVHRDDKEIRKFKPGDDFYIQGFYVDLAERKIHRISVPEVNEVYAAVATGERAWFAGMTGDKAVLVGVGDQDRIVEPLPEKDEIPDLGIDGRSLLAVYSKKIYSFADRQWTLVHSGDIPLPRSGFPPRRHGHMVFFRDEGSGESNKQLWWLAMGEQPCLRLLARNTGLFQPFERPGYTRPIGPPGWQETSSYCVTPTGDLWACVAGGSYLLRRSPDGNCSIAIMDGSVRFTKDLPGSGGMDPQVSVSAVAALTDDTLLLAGRTGFYRLKGNELTQEVAFSGSVPEWSTILAVDDQSYLLGTALHDGLYLLRRDDSDQWTCLPVDGGWHSPVVVW